MVVEYSKTQFKISCYLAPSGRKRSTNW